MIVRNDGEWTKGVVGTLRRWRRGRRVSLVSSKLSEISLERREWAMQTDIGQKRVMGCASAVWGQPWRQLQDWRRGMSRKRGLGEGTKGMFKAMLMAIDTSNDLGVQAAEAQRCCGQVAIPWKQGVVCGMGESLGEGGELSRNRTESGIESDRCNKKKTSLSSRNWCVLSEVLTCLLTYQTDKICVKVF